MVGYTCSRTSDEPSKIQYNGIDKAFLPAEVGAAVVQLDAE